MWRQLFSISSIFTKGWGQSQSLLSTPPLERIIPLGHSARASCHRCHETIVHSLHPIVRIPALFTRVNSDDSFHVIKWEKVTVRPRGIGEALQYTFTAISKLNFKHIYLKFLRTRTTSSDLCLRTQLAMSISP